MPSPEAAVSETTQTPGIKLYYSRNSNAQFCNVTPTKLVPRDDGRYTELPGKEIIFNRVGQSHFGSYATDDPDCIAYLEAMIADCKAHGRVCEILTVDEFNSAVTPKDTQIERLQEELRRRLEENNRLLEQLKKDANLRKQNP